MTHHSRGTIPIDLPIAVLSLERGIESEQRSSSAPPTSSADNSPLLDQESISGAEFWDALSSNYDYLMDDGLIATCREASSDLSLDDECELEEVCCWTFTRFIEQFKWLHDLLHNLQVAKEDDTKERSMKIFEEQQKIAYLCNLFNEQAQKLCKRYPDMKDEVNRRLNLLNNKWKAVELSIHPNIIKSPAKDVMFKEITNHMCSLRRLLRDLENRICTVSSASSWKVDILEENYKLQVTLQKEIESKGKHVSVLLKLCEHLKGNVRFGQSALMLWDAEQVKKVANNLQHRWHSIWLKSLECICVLENLMDGPKKSCEKLDKSFSEEPLKKYPRLSDTYETLSRLENKLKGKTMNAKAKEDISVLQSLPEPLQQKDAGLQLSTVTVKNDKAVMVGATGIAELKADCGTGGKFEIIQDVGYSSETSAHLSTEERIDPTPESAIALAPNMYLAPDKYPSISLKTLNILAEDKSSFSSRHNTSKRPPDTFYKVACIDDELLEDISQTESPLKIKESMTCNNEVMDLQVTMHIPQQMTPLPNTPKSQTASSKNDLVASQTTPKTHRSVEKCIIKNLLKSIEKECKQHLEISSAKKSRRNSKTACQRASHPPDIWGKSARVSEWLNTCQSVDDYTSDDNLSNKVEERGDWLPKVVNSSCDASGECTTAESDSEKSTTSDVNNSVTFSQSFTGSIETVIPVACEEPTIVQSGSLEPSPGSVQLRMKKQTNRDRPWSVIELKQSSLAHSTSVPHSTSDGALDLLCSAQDSGKTLSKTHCPKKKRKSLTDISTYYCPPQEVQSNSKASNEQNSSGSEHRNLKKKGSISDQSSDNCGTLLCSPNSDALDTVNNVLPVLDLHLSDCANKQTDVQIIMPEVLSLDTDVAECTVNTEDQGSLSDQAWDEYQDPPYLSEPYSEQTVDEDELKKLTESSWDNYWDTLGRYSDASSVSLRVPRHRTRTRSSLTKSKCGESCNSTDSNSDCEDFHNILKTSSQAFQSVSNSIKDNTRKIFFSELAELVATCQTHLCHLNDIAAAESELESVSKEDVSKLRDLIKDWEDLQVKLLVLKRNDQQPASSSSINLVAAKTDVQSSLVLLKEKLDVMAEHATGAIDTAISLEQIANNIQNLQTGLSNLQDLKESVLSVSARILRLISEGGGNSLGPLRENATKLYQQWEDVYELNCSQLTKLQKLQSSWSESTEEHITEEFEITVQWQPVQVGDSLPTAQLKREALQPKTAAEVVAADQHDFLLDLQDQSSCKPTIHPCILAEELKEDETLQEPLLHLNLPVQKMSHLNATTSKDDPSTPLPPNRSCLWRTLRAAFPIQVILIAIYCLSCLSLEPKCCENMNNYDFSLIPQLRYLRGPPPV